MALFFKETNFPKVLYSTIGGSVGYYSHCASQYGEC